MSENSPTSYTSLAQRNYKIPGVFGRFKEYIEAILGTSNTIDTKLKNTITKTHEDYAKIMSENSSTK